MKVVVSGAGGFIGSHLCTMVASAGFDVLGIDNGRASYGTELPSQRLHRIATETSVTLFREDLLSTDLPGAMTRVSPIDAFVHLAAWPGVRQSEEQPAMYLRNNVQALSSALRLARALGARRFIFASSSSVYGDSGASGPTREDDVWSTQRKSYYAATKFTGEAISRDFCRASGMEYLGLRFFTVIGAFGRPDMAYATFARHMLRDEPVPVYGDGSSLRDYSSVTDVVDVITRLLAADLPSSSSGPSALDINIGFGQPRPVMALVEAVASTLRVAEPKIEFRDAPSADARGTWADPTLLQDLIGPRVPTSLESMVADALSEPDWIWL